MKRIAVGLVTTLAVASCTERFPRPRVEAVGEQRAVAVDGASKALGFGSVAHAGSTRNRVICAAPDRVRGGAFLRLPPHVGRSRPPP